jgi:ribosomal protein S18 acetylase RimI-like enzyme
VTDNDSAAPTIREFTEADWPQTWRIIEPVFRAGETYPCAREISEAESHSYWIDKPQATYIVELDGTILGSYYIKPNSEELGAHVCNCGYIVSKNARGQGVGSAMCAHSQDEAARLGFRAMQYNLVVASNEKAVRLWQKHGMQIVGTLPGAFRHAELGYVDAHIMYKELTT